MSKAEKPVYIDHDIATLVSSLSVIQALIQYKLSWLNTSQWALLFAADLDL